MVNGAVRQGHFAIPPYTVEPHNPNSIHDWASLQGAIRNQIHYKIEIMEELPSNAVFERLSNLSITLIPQQNLTAFAAHMPLIAGGCKSTFPKTLVNKKC